MVAAVGYYLRDIINSDEIIDKIMYNAVSMYTKLNWTDSLHVSYANRKEL